MRPSLALSIGAAFGILTGAPFVVAPALVLSTFGFENVPALALVQARDTGTLLIGVGIIDWLARDAVGPPLRGLLWGNIFIRIAAIAVNTWEFATGQIPGASVAAVPIAYAISIAFIAVFALALRRA